MEPLANRLRPKRLDDVLGQERLLGPDGILRRRLATGSLGSLILYGPPGSGKTTVARLLASELGLVFRELNATSAGLPELRKLLIEAADNRLAGRGTLILADEIHRWAKNQQEALLGPLERGEIVLVGATTEPPAAGALVPALLSRTAVVRLDPLDEPTLVALIERGLALLAEDGHPLALDDDARRNLVGLADGDGRRLLGLLEAGVAEARGGVLDGDGVKRLLARRDLPHDGSGVTSAMIKSLRAGDEDAALYYAAVIIESGADREHLFRRLAVAAVEDTDPADGAIAVVMACWDAYRRIGPPEEHYLVAYAIERIARARKSIAHGAAFERARADVRERGAGRVPAHLRASAKTYRHPAGPEGDAGQAYLPAGRGPYREDDPRG